MIVYLATYPRSGNSLLQQIVITHFRFLPSQIADEGPLIHENWTKYWAFQPDADMLFGTYTQKKPVNGSRRFDLRAWITGPRDRLTPELRKRMAAEENVYFIKHHDLPPAEHFEGEFVIQSVRHPGAVFRSYLSLMQGRGQVHDATGSPLTMRSIIEGNVMFGDWSDYHRAWDASPVPMTRLSFEKMSKNHDIIARAVHRITGLPYSAESAIPLSAIRKNNPEKGRHGSSRGWMSAFSRNDLVALRERHRPYARRLGYRLGNGFTDWCRDIVDHASKRPAASAPTSA